MSTAAVLLAAGASRRFGPQNKLLTPFHGKPLITYAAEALRSLTPDFLIGVTKSESIAELLDGFEIAVPTEPDLGQANSLRAGISVARVRGASKVLVVLGDMPFVDTIMLQQIVALCTYAWPSAASDGVRSMPPACFPAPLFPELMNLQGDCGAATLLQNIPENYIFKAPKRKLYDIDTPRCLISAPSLSFL
jgi:CTP:molybdopterin cytidylyltransferase MocA